MARLSTPLTQMKDHYAVVVVGSGYGGSIAASRLARAGQQVCLLERGKEFQPGQYPDTATEAMGELQMDLPQSHLGPATGLYDLRVNKDINVMVGCGLGGTSLINANVCGTPEARVFEDPQWPAALRQDVGHRLAEGFRRAQEMLKPTSYPGDQPALAKSQALEKSAAHLNSPFYRLPIKVTFQDGVNHVGVSQRACTLCGDCVSGCNYAAKNTLIMNYLPDARNHGAEIFTQVAVRWLERRGDRWLVHYQVLESGREVFDAPPMQVSADLVILAAGTLGSTEILLRSQAAGLTLSDHLGLHFTGNGDVLGFSYNNDLPINAIGLGSIPPSDLPPVGPTITGIIDRREQPNLEDGMVIEEGAIPGALAPLLPKAFALAAATVGRDTDAGLADLIKEKAREMESLLRGPHHGALANTQTYLVMTHDDCGGRMHLENDRLRLDWPGVGEQPIFHRVNDALLRATEPLGGTYVQNPIWSKLFERPLVTVHPLGGCIMAENAAQGVVNHKGQVFSGKTGDNVHDGLYVCDGSIIPRSLGINPLYTICALAERCFALLAQDRGWQINYQLPSAPPAPAPPERLGLRFTETMKGHFSTKVKDDYARGAEQGRQDNSSFEFILTIVTDDLEAMLTEPQHRAPALGTVTAPALSIHPLTVTDGEFQLFVADPDRPRTRNMRYRMKLTSREGRHYYFSGFKVIHDDPGFDVWADTTTLYITVYDGDSDQAAVLGKGILRIYPEDFVKQLTTMEVMNAKSLMERLAATARFGRFFAGTLFDLYGGLVPGGGVLAPEAPPRKKRPLRVGVPEVHFFPTQDGVELRLTRYQGGTKGPVLLAHGLGVSSLIFAADTIDTNLVEYLFAHGFDVWLLDYRASIELPAAATQFTGDEVALYDYPAAVARVLEATGAPSLEVLAHCFGATTFTMALLAGLTGVRAAVLSQIAAHVVVPTLTRLKTGLHLPTLLEALGVETLTARPAEQQDWWGPLYDKFLKLYPVEAEERCESLVCRRITFMYGQLFEHDQLNAATHAALHELFGVANVAAFQHLALMARRGEAVAADGSNRYLPHLERLALPLAFIHGAENQVYLPESTAITYDLLCRAYGRHLYSRHLIANYGHIDCIFGKNAVVDVYPIILRHLETHAHHLG